MKKKLFLAGCWAMIVTGVFHTLGHVQMMRMPTQGANPTETQLLQLMQTYRDPQIGRTTLELMLGFSLLFSIFSFGTGIIGLLSARKGNWIPLVANFVTVMTGLMLVTSLIYFFIAPTACLGTAFVLLAASMLVKT